MSKAAGKTFILTPSGTLVRHTTNIGELMGTITKSKLSSDQAQEMKVNLVIPRISIDTLQRQLNIRRETKVRSVVKFNKTDSVEEYSSNSLYIGDHTEPKAPRTMRMNKNENSVNIKLWS
jgi:hypothetical protein